MECLLTEKALKVRKGVFVRVEKTIPLDKITDMGMVQGPVMRYFDLHKLTIETAGQSGSGALVSLTGIKDVKSFREAVLDQRDEIASALLSEIRDSLLSIEVTLDGKYES